MRTVLRGVTVIDGLGNEPVPRRDVVVDGDSIAGIHEEGWAEGQHGDIDVLELTGCTLLPGLIDCHEHLTMKNVTGAFEHIMELPAASLTAIAIRNGWYNLLLGVTTIRDMAAVQDVNLALRDDLARGWLMGPRILTCGRPVCITGGHAYFLSSEADGPDGIRRASRAALKSNADFLKVMTSHEWVAGNRPTAIRAEMTVPEIEAAVDVAHGFQKRITAHANGRDAVRNCVNAGVDCIEHGAGMDLESARAFAARGGYLVPTISAAIQSLNPRWGRPYWESVYGDLVPLHREGLHNAAVAGVSLALGSDIVGDLVEEMQCLVEVGLTPIAAIQAGTRNGAELLGIADTVGTIEAGKLADLLIVAGDPLADLTALHNVKYVFKSGVRIDPDVVRGVLLPPTAGWISSEVAHAH